MEKIEKSITKNYLTVKVFLDDLEAIESALKESSERLEIKTDEYSFSSVEELKAQYKDQTLKRLEISSLNPYIRIEFTPLWVRLYSGSDSTSSAGLFYKLNSIISTTTRKPEFFYSYTFTGLLNLLALASLLLPKEFKVAILVFLSILVLWLCYVAYIRLMNSSKIIMMKRHDLKGFFQRNKDILIVGFFTSIVTIFVTLLLSNNWSSIQSFLKGIFKP
jgi:hypothetical protein